MYMMLMPKNNLDLFEMLSDDNFESTIFKENNEK